MWKSEGVELFRCVAQRGTTGDSSVGTGGLGEALETGPTLKAEEVAEKSVRMTYEIVKPEVLE